MKLRKIFPRGVKQHDKWKKKLITMSVSAALVTTLFVGAGTFAYLQANTGTITNKFGKDKDAEELLLKLEEVRGSRMY